MDHLVFTLLKQGKKNEARALWTGVIYGAVFSVGVLFIAATAFGVVDNTRLLIEYLGELKAMEHMAETMPGVK